MTEFIIATLVIGLVVFLTWIFRKTPVTATRARAKSGDAEAQFELGKMYGEGQGVSKNFAKAMRWYRRAGEQGHVQAQRLVTAYDGAEQGDPWEQSYLALLYSTGDGVAQDLTYAYVLHSLAVDRWDLKFPDAPQHVVQLRENSIRSLADLEATMSPNQIAEAQLLAREWDAAHPR